MTAAAIAPAVPVSSAAGCDMQTWRRAIEHYTERRPRAEAVDLYKLTQQGIMGSEHAVTDTAAVNAWMRQELATLSRTVRTGEELVEPLPPDGRFVRVNLRPFIAAGGDPAKLVRAFVATANETKGDTAQFACVESALSGTRQGVLNRLSSLIRERRKTGFDAVHHSRAFETAYVPAYRVVRASLADSLGVTSRRPALK